MFAKTIIVFIATSLAAFASAAPTMTTRQEAAVVADVPLTGVTHFVVAGPGGKLVFEPNNVVAEVGDIVEWHFAPRNHSVIESSFGEPCMPRQDGGAGTDGVAFSSGFFPVAEGQSNEVFKLVVRNKEPIWYYCSQTTGNHCQSGMVGVINQNVDGPNTLSAHMALAAQAGTSVTPTGINGGERTANTVGIV